MKIQLQHKNMIQKTYQCFSPFNQIYISYDGKLAPCCHMKTTNRHQLNIEEIKNISDLYNHPFLEKIRNSFENNKIPEECKNCCKINREKILNKVDSSLYYSKLPNKYYLIGCFAQCNLQCKMCNSAASTSLLKAFPKNYYTYTETKPFTEKIIQNLGSYIKNNKEQSTFHLCGGEPLIDTTLEPLFNLWKDKTIFEYNKFSIQSNLASNSNLANKRLKIICNSPVNVSFSLDGPPHIHDYIRNSKWAEIQKNLDLMNFYNKTISTINVVTQALNIGYLPELLEFVKSINHLHLTISADSTELTSVYTLPKEILKTYLEKLQKYDFNNHQYKNLVISIKKYIQTSGNNDNMWNKFCKKINYFDKVQHKNVSDIYPEWQKFWIYE